MQTLVHDAVIRISLAGTEYALVVMREANQIDAVILVVICVDLLASLKIIESNGKVFAPSH